MQLSTCLCIFGGANTHSISTYRYTPYAREYSGLFLYISRIFRSPCNYLHVFVYLAEQIDIVSVYAPYAREYSGLFLYIYLVSLVVRATIYMSLYIWRSK